MSDAPAETPKNHVSTELKLAPSPWRNVILGIGIACILIILTSGYWRKAMASSDTNLNNDRNEFVFSREINSSGNYILKKGETVHIHKSTPNKVCHWDDIGSKEEYSYRDDCGQSFVVNRDDFDMKSCQDMYLQNNNDEDLYIAVKIY